MELTISCLPGSDVQKIESEYHLKVYAIERIDDGKYRADTDRGWVSIERQGYKRTRLIFIGGVADAVLGSGTVRCGKIYHTGSGKCYIDLFDGAYMMSEVMKGRAFDFGSPDDLRDAGHLIANFHLAAAGYAPPPGGNAPSSWGKWPGKYAAKVAKIKKYRDALTGRKKLTEFDTVFFESCGTYIERMEESVRKLKAAAYLDAVERSMKSMQVCLCDLKRSNFIRRRGEIYAVSLKKCSHDMAETDIAEFYREYAEHGGLKGASSKFLDAYTEIRELPGGSSDTIKTLIAFPSEFEKVCSRYYKGGDAGTEQAYVRKLLSAEGCDDRKLALAEDLGWKNN